MVLGWLNKEEKNQEETYKQSRKKEGQEVAKCNLI